MLSEALVELSSSSSTLAFLNGGATLGITLGQDSSKFLTLLTSLLLLYEKL